MRGEPSTRSAALAAVAVLSMALVACSGGSGQGAGNGGETAQSLAEKAQYNPQPYENIKDGGTLTTSLPEISPQFNTFQTDGTAYTLTVWRWYNPILITFTADGDAGVQPGLPDRRQAGDGRREHQDHLHDQPEGHLQRRLADRLALVRVHLEDQQRHGPGLPG